MNLRKTITLATFALAGLSLAHAADIAGKWTAEFESPIGVQKYVYEFKVDGDKISGKATFDNSMGKGDSALTQIKLSGDDLSFVEQMKLDGNEITVTYTGKIAGDEIKFTRNVGDFGTEQLVAKRQKAPESKPAPAK